MDPISLTLSILPICLTAMQGFSALRTKLKILRHHSQEVKRVRKKLTIQTRCFEDEIHLLLKEILEPHMAWSMMEDKNHVQWIVPDVETMLKGYLGPKRYQEFMETAQEVETTIKEIQAKLAVFAAPDEKVHWTKSAKDAFTVTFKNQGFKDDINTLKESIEELKRLRKTVNKLRRHEEASPRPSSASQSLVRYFKAVRAASLDFHDCLQNTSVCNEDFHSHHDVKLMLRCIPSHQEETKLALLLEFAGQDGYVSLRGRLPFLISCQTQPSNDVGVSPNGISRSDRDFRDSSGGPVPKRQKFSGQSDISTAIISEDSGVRSRCHTPDLTASTATSSLCRQLAPCSITPARMTPAPQRRLSYLQRFKLEAGSADIGGLIDCKNTVLVDLFNQPVYDVTTDRQRVELALILVKATLKHWNTPWWPVGCLLSTVSFFGQPGCDLGSCLSTLHVTTPVGSTRAAEDMDMVNGSQGGVSEDDRHRLREDIGIRNLVLYCLGVALLQIGLWDYVPWNDHKVVRRRTDRLNSLGRKYHNATERLIDCDFGVGKNLNDEALQVAICDTVAADLESWLKESKKADPRR